MNGAGENSRTRGKTFRKGRRTGYRENFRTERPGGAGMKQAAMGGLAAALLGMLFCIWTALGNEVAFCVTAGCSLYQDLVIGGLSMWWIGTAAFGVLACLALLGAVLGIMVSFDLGGPVNKAAYTFCVGAMAEGILMPYAAFASVKMFSGFAITAATKLAGKLFTKEEQDIGRSTWILVLAGITEGAIPFMMADPIRVIFPLCAGSAVTGAIIGSMGIGLDAPGAGIFSLFLLKGGVGDVANAAIWFFAAVIGAAVSTVLLVALRKSKLRKAEKKVD